MGEIVYLNAIRASKRLKQLEKEEKECRESRGFETCAECPDFGECPIHQKMLEEACE